jgi:eukaryotic-like serine/threonine-protein kinase
MNAEEICAGDTLGRYQLLVPIAQGGTASVWAARMKGPRGFEKIVAVKVMLPEFSEDSEAESMFLDEARLVSRIRNPNVAEVLDLGEQDGALFIVMEWIDGEQLNVVMREARSQGGVPLPIAVRIVRQACDGLHAAHDLVDNDGRPVSLVHRDVSPQNLLAGYDGTVKVIDFGVAKATSNSQRTNVGQLKGKVAYMAPEQAYGDTVDRRTDVFALGIVLYQLVTGKHPLRGDNEYATLGRIRDKRPVDPPSVHHSSVPNEVEQVILKALAKDRDQRFATMQDMSQALDAAFPTNDAPSRDKIAEYMARLLGHRGEKKRLAIREAIRTANENKRTPTMVPAAFEQPRDPDEVRSASSRQLPRPPGVVPSPPGPRATPYPPPTTPYPPPVAVASFSTDGRLPQAYPPGDLDAEPSFTTGRLVPGALDLGEAIPDFRKRRLSVKVVAVGMALVVLIVIAILSASGGSYDPEAPTDSGATKKPFF